MISKNICLFEIISGQDFKEYLQELININTTYENLLVDNLLSYSTTVSRNIIKNAESIKLL